MAKRTVALFGMMIAALFFTVLSVYSLSTGTSLAEAAKEQQNYTVTIKTTRGTIYDCSFRALTGSGKENYITAVVPGADTAVSLNRSLSASEMRTVYPLLSKGKPFVLKLSHTIAASGADVFPVRERYNEKQDAVHLIGYLDGSGNGAAGIEKAFDSQLKADQGRITVSYPVDALGHFLPGEQKTVSDTSSRQKSGVVLTLDKTIQKLVEQASEKYLSKGAAIVLEVPSGKIRASVSLPVFSPNHVGSVLKSEDSPLLNRALSSYSVGSVFKLVAAASALEYGISPQEEYTCTGSITVDQQKFHCYHSEKHGMETMQEAVAHSCNTYFINLMQKVPSSQFLQMARLLGFGRSFEIAPGISSCAGVLPTEQNLKVPRALANFSIGQGQLTATPMQIAAMVNAIASGGRFTQPYLYEGLVNEKLEYTEKAGTVSGVRVMKEQTAELIREFMNASIEEGTSVHAKPAHGSAGAKTATAQTGKYINGVETNNSWIAGFYPYENPQYVIVVFAEGGEGGGTTCAPVFREIADGLYQLGKVG